MMNGVNIAGIVAAGAAAIVCVSIYVLSRRFTRTTRWGIFVTFAIFSIPSLLVAAYYLQLPLEHAWFYEMRSWSGSEFLILPVAVATGIFGTFLPRPLFAGPLSALLAIAVIPYLKPVLMPLTDHDFQAEWKGDTCIQSTSSTCGPASIATISRRLGGTISEKGAARAAHTYQNGTEAWYLARYLRKQGYEVYFDFRDTFSPEVEFPAVVGVKLGRIGHFIPVLAAWEDEIVIADPLQGEERISRQEFHQRYGFTGFHMPVSRRKP